jgi:hypothetical protein
VTDAMTRSEPKSGAVDIGARQEQFKTSVEAKADGQWLAVVNLGDGASVSKLFDTRFEALHYGDELAAWLATRGSA